MVVHESFVTRKPLEFTIIVLFIILVLLLPVYFLTRDSGADDSDDYTIPETFSEAHFLFGPESDLTESEKKQMFRINYEGNFVKWSGRMLGCSEMTPLFRVSVDQTGDGFGDVLFTTFQNCTEIPSGSTILYKTRLIDLKVRTFTGKDGEIISWD